MERGLDPLTTFLVVADASRTTKTICLAVTPALKSFGISGRARLFEVIQRVGEVNAERRRKIPGHRLSARVTDISDYTGDPASELDFITAPPRMALYIRRSTEIYRIYLKYFAPEDIHVYSVDEVFIDATNYLDLYGLSPHDLVRRVIQDVLETTGITATAGIGTNLYLCKVAMDIVAKKAPADQDGVRIAELDEMSYRQTLWDHRPLTDFWRVGPGYSRKLEAYGMYTMGDIARCSLGDRKDYRNEDLLYRLFGIGAETLIDHAWGWEPCTMEEIKSYRPEAKSLGSGQVLTRPYRAEEARIVASEMLDVLSLDLLSKRLVTEQITLTVGYDRASLMNTNGASSYQGEIRTDHYGRKVPKHAHGTTHLRKPTALPSCIVQEGLRLFDRIVDPDLLVRRISVTAEQVLPESAAWNRDEQLDLFTDYARKQREEDAEKKEADMQRTILAIKRKYGKNAILRGTNFMQGATMRERNQQIGGHKA